MSAASRILLVTALGLGFASDARADDKKPEKPKPAAEPGKPLVIQIDASKLPPDVLRQLLQPAAKPTGGPGVKPAGKPGAKPTGEPVKPGTKPGGEKVVKPGNKPEVKPGEKVAKPGSQDEIIRRLEKLSIQIEELRKSIQK